MRHPLFTLAAASVAFAAPSALNERQVNAPSAVDGVINDTPLATTPALDLGPLPEQLIAQGGGLQFKGDMTQEEMDAMREIEALFTDLRQKLQAIEGRQPTALTRRQLDIITGLVSGLPIVGPLVGSLLGGVTGGGGDLNIGGLTGGLGGILGRTKPEDLSVEEMDMLKEAEVLMENFLRDVAATNGDNLEGKKKVQRRQLDFLSGLLSGLPIVGPLLQNLLGGGLLGGVTGALGGVTGGLTGGAGGAAGGPGGTLDGVTNTVVGLADALTGGGGAGGALSGLTGTLDGLTGGLDIGGLLGKKPEDLRVSEEQMAMARGADAILVELAEKIEAEGRAQ